MKLTYKILVLSFSSLHNDPRVYRHISFLNDTHTVHTLGYTPSGIKGTIHTSLTFDRPKTFAEKSVSALLLLLRFFTHYYNSQLTIQNTRLFLKNNSFDVIIANDIDALPVALENKKNAKVIFDAHEYAPREFEDKWIWRLFFQRYKTHLCRRYIPQADRMITVCEGIANEYQKQFGIKPEVITNAPAYASELKPSTVNSKKIRIIHHGGAMDSRQIERMIEMMDYTDSRFELYLMLVPTQPKYYELLKKMAENRSNVQFVKPVPMQTIADEINQYDIGLYILESNSFNNQHALPNKFFEFIQARLCIAIGPSPEMERIVHQYELGIISNNFSPLTMAQQLNALSSEAIFRYKGNADKHAFSLSAQSNSDKLNQIVHSLLKAESCAE